MAHRLCQGKGKRKHPHSKNTRSFRASPKKHSRRLELTKPRTSLPDATGPPLNPPYAVPCTHYPVRHHSSAQSPLEALGSAGLPPRSGRRPCDVAGFSIHATSHLTQQRLQSSLPDDSAPTQHPICHHSSAQSPLEALGPAGPPPQSGRRPCDVDRLSHDASLRLATLPCMLHNAQSILTLPSRRKNLCQSPSSPIRHHSAAEIPHPVREGVPVMSSVSATMLCFASRLCPV